MSLSRAHRLSKCINLEVVAELVSEAWIINTLLYKTDVLIVLEMNTFGTGDEHFLCGGQMYLVLERTL